MARTPEIFDYHLIVEAGGEGEVVAPTILLSPVSAEEAYYYFDDYQWMNGDHLSLSLSGAPITAAPFKTNRPIEERNGSLHAEILNYD